MLSIFIYIQYLIHLRFFCVCRLVLFLSHFILPTSLQASNGSGTKPSIVDFLRLNSSFCQEHANKRVLGQGKLAGLLSIAKCLTTARLGYRDALFISFLINISFSIFFYLIVTLLNCKCYLHWGQKKSYLFSMPVT